MTTETIKNQLAAFNPGGVLFRFAAISFVNVFNHQLFFYLGQNVFDLKPWVANVCAAVLAAIPAYLMSRYWVWKVAGKNSLKDEIVPFIAVSILGLAISTGCVRLAETLTDNKLLFQVASLVGYVIAWVIKFALLNRVFKKDEQVEYAIDDCWDLSRQQKN